MSGFIDIPENPAPRGGALEEIAAPDGATLRIAYFPADAPRGTVVLVTGWSEFIEKYFETVIDLQSRGLNVAMMDWRGQGLSDRQSARKTKWQGYFHTLADDLRHFTETHVKSRFDGPYILMTHSMGGLPALLLMAEGYPGFDRAVLCAPMTRLFPKKQNRSMGKIASITNAVGLARFNTPRGRNHADIFEGNIFTSDQGRHTRFTKLRTAKPNAASTTPSFGWVNAAIKASHEMHAPDKLSEIATPTLIVSAGKEQQIDGSDHAEIASASDLISLETIPDALHEIMMERDDIRELYFKAFDDFTAPVLAR